MKIIRWFLLALGLLLLISSLSYAQSGSCGDPSQVLYYRAHCYSPVCHGVVLVPSAAGCTGGSCDFFQNVTVDCCGFQAVTAQDVGACGFAKLRDERARRQILALLENQRVLVPECGGSYVPAGSLLKPE